LHELKAGWKLSGQVVSALICVLAGVRVESITLPFIHHVDFGVLGGPLTLIGLVAVMNAVNFSDGADGLAAGVCAISSAALAIIAFDLGTDLAGVLAAIVCGAAVGFLVHNFYPASVFMGDSGSNLLGLLLGVVMVEGSVKTNALIALFVPLIVLAVPFLDTSFVIAKRLKYRRPVYHADSNHFHHRFYRIGFSQRKAVLYLYLWTLIMAGLAVSMRFIPYTDGHGNFKLVGSVIMAICFSVALVASVYLVYLLELVKWRSKNEKKSWTNGDDMVGRSGEQHIVSVSKNRFRSREDDDHLVKDGESARRS
jgi:UDP-GlcNAc:undecaprenyl-phosphate/decaprenyl-phosphate GlcNAc-1-phosphate transferase